MRGGLFCIFMPPEFLFNQCSDTISRYFFSHTSNQPLLYTQDSLHVRHSK